MWGTLEKFPKAEQLIMLPLSNTIAPPRTLKLKSFLIIQASSTYA